MREHFMALLPLSLEQNKYVPLDLEVSTASVDQLGLVMSAMDDLGFIKLVDKYLDGDRAHQRITLGERSAAMVLHLMSFMNRTMYQTPEFLSGYALDHLFGKDIDANAFNDDAMGRLLDEIYAYGPEKFYQTMAMSMIAGKKLAGNSLRLDSTSMSIQ